MHWTPTWLSATSNVYLQMPVWKSTRRGFPEMQRPSNVDAPVLPDRHVTGHYETLCHSKVPYIPGLPPDQYVEDGICSCPGCEHRRLFDKLCQALTSHFARDPDIREGFLDHYFKLVRFRWYRGSEPGGVRIQTLPDFLGVYEKRVQVMKHLTLQIDWKYSGLHAPVPTSSVFSPDWENDNSFRTDAFELGMLFAIMQQYRIKAELIFSTTDECRRPMIQRVEALCRQHVQRNGEPFCKR